MEEAIQWRKRRGSYDLRPKLLLSNFGTDLEEDEELYESEDEDELYEPPRSKQCRKKTHSAEFPVEVLDIISKRVSIVDFLNMGKVCRSWRLSVSTFKLNFMSSYTPLVMYISSRDKKSCHFYDMSTRSKYKTKLPTPVPRVCLGCSSGYLIMQDFLTNIWAVNPVTGHNIKFPKMPPMHKVTYLGDRAIFASFGCDSDFVLMVLWKEHNHIQYCISRDTTEWKYVSFVEEPWKILDLVVSDGRVYALTDDSRIGVFNFRTNRLSLKTVAGTPHLTGFIRLVASKNQLLIVDLFPLLRVRVYGVDLENMKCVEMDELGGEALFVGNWMASKIGGISKWRGLRDFVYHLPFIANWCRGYSLRGEHRAIFPSFLRRRRVTTKIICWYFLNQAYSPDNIIGDDN